MSSRGDSIRARISEKYEKTPGYLIYELTEAVGQEMDECDASISEVADKLNADNLKGDDLTRFVFQRKGISRKEATFATGTVTVQGTGTVTAGDVFETENGVQFAATEEVEVQTTADIPIIAKIAGNGGIVGAGSITQMPVTISGIASCTNAAATTGGYDAEEDDALRTRYYTAVRTPATSGNKAQYKNWTLEVPGIGDAQVYPLGHGDGTVDVVIIDSNQKPASESLVAAVQAYIDPSSEGKGNGVAPIGARCYVSSAATTSINLAGKVIIKSGSTQANVELKIKNAVEEYLRSIAFSGKAVSYAQLSGRITDVTDVLDIENLKVNDGVTNITIPNRYVAVLETVVFTYA